MQAVAENLWVMCFPLRLLGTALGRIVTLLRLRSGEIVIHSTAPFSSEDVAAILALGRPSALVEATLVHDAFARQGRAAFVSVPYFAPEDFSRATSLSTHSYSALPPSWENELEVLLLEGMPKIREHVFFHRPSRTLVVADLVFNFGPDTPRWTRLFFNGAGGIRHYPGMSRIFRAMIRDRAAFSQSIETMLKWDFDRVIVGHGAIIETDGKSRVRKALASQGF